MKLRASGLFAAAVFSLAASAGSAQTTATAPAPVITTDRVKALETKAAAGDAAAMYQLALELQFGVATPLDLPRARKLLEQAIAAGNCEAMDHLGDMNFLGEYGALIDYDAAAKYYKMERVAGGAWGAFALGAMYERGQGIQQNLRMAKLLYDEGLANLKKNIDRGGAPFISAMADAYARGHGMDADLRMAIIYRQKAIKAGDIWSLVTLGAMYENGEGVDQDYSKALECYEKSAARGVALGLICAGQYYELGRGTAQDAEKALAYYKKAAERGSAFAMINLGWLYERGVGEVGRDKKAALEWYGKALQQNHYYAALRMGAILMDDGTAESRIRALQLYRKAARAGDENAMNALKALDEE